MTEEDDRQPTTQEILKNVRVGKNLTVGNITQTIIQRSEGSRPTRSRSESLLLQAVKQEVISRLDQSLHNAVFINLGKQPQPQQVKRPWDAEIKIGSRLPEALPAETTILEVFDRPGIDGRLLILGEPGAGKTTTMLDLVKGLCDRAEQDATAFIPVLLNLSSWKDPKQTMTAWLVEELKSKYGVRKDIGTKWLADKHLLPLLDGLDEVKPEHQEGCVQAINRWLESDDRPLSLAVCCRREEYEKVVRGQWQAATEELQNETRMHLNGAVLLQPLTDEQIQSYLTAANQPELWQMLRQDEGLWELIRTPLWLSITLLSYEGLSLSQWQQTASTEQRLSLLLDAYVQRMLHRRLNSQIYGKRKPPNAKQTRRWLIYLATQLQRESQTEFLIEQMQPSMLQKKHKQIYRLTIGLIAGIPPGFVAASIFFSIFLIGYLQDPSAMSKENFSLSIKFTCFFVLAPTLTFGLSIGLIAGSRNYIYLIETLNWSWRDAVKQGLRSGLKSTVFLTFFLGLPAGLLLAYKSLGSSFLVLYITLITGLIHGLLALPLLGIASGLKGQEINIKNIPNQGVWRSAKHGLIVGFATALSIEFTFFSLTILLLLAQQSTELSTYLFIGMTLGTIVGSIIGLNASLAFGGAACIQHFALRCVLFRNGSIPWNYARFLNYCTERLLLQRVGGRYRFIHKSLQEHFARMGE